MDITVVPFICRGHPQWIPETMDGKIPYIYYVLSYI